MRFLRALLLVALAVLSVQVQAQQPKAGGMVQFINNISDCSIPQVDLYLIIPGFTAQKLRDDWSYKSATPFEVIPGGIQVRIGIARANSSSVSDTIASFPYTFAVGESYVIMLSGVNGNGFAANPNGVNIKMNGYKLNNARTTGTNFANVDVIGFNGTTDAPTIDIYQRGNSAPIFNDVRYGSYSSNYVSLPAQEYVFEVTASNNNTPIAGFNASLSAFAGRSAVIFTSGFVNPSANSNCSRMTMLAAFPEGKVIEFERSNIQNTQPAKIQIIHNAPEAGVTDADLYLSYNGSTVLKRDFAFRQATQFIDVPGNTPIHIGLAGGNSFFVTDTIKNFEMTFEPNKNYVVILSGVTNPFAGYSGNPDGQDISLKAFPLSDALLQSRTSGQVDVAYFHGTLDAPTMDVYFRGSTTPFVDNIRYGQYQYYRPVAAQNGVLELTPANATNRIGAFQTPFAQYANQSMVIFGSGFLFPFANNNGAAFCLFAALPNGTVFPLNPVAIDTGNGGGGGGGTGGNNQNAKIQFIHNSSDTAVNIVDLWIVRNGFAPTAIRNFCYHTQTGFLTVPAGETFKIVVTPKNSTSPLDTIRTYTYNLTANREYISIFDGVLRSGFIATPNRNIALNFYTVEGREKGTTNNRLDLAFHNGITDAPKIDVIYNDAPVPVVAGLDYPQTSPYYSFTPNVMRFKVAGSESGVILPNNYQLNATQMAGNAGVIVFSGFMNPSANNNGWRYGLFYVSTVAGEFLPLEITNTSVEETELAPNALTPNPVSNVATLSYTVANEGTVEISVVDNMGNVVTRINQGTQTAGSHTASINASTLASGAYTVRVLTNGTASHFRFAVVK